MRSLCLGAEVIILDHLEEPLQDEETIQKSICNNVGRYLYARDDIAVPDWIRALLHLEFFDVGDASGPPYDVVYAVLVSIMPSFVSAVSQLELRPGLLDVLRYGCHNGSEEDKRISAEELATGKELSNDINKAKLLTEFMKVEVREVNEHVGLGVFATADIHKDTKVGAFFGFAVPGYLSPATKSAHPNGSNDVIQLRNKNFGLALNPAPSCPLQYLNHHSKSLGPQNCEIREGGGPLQVEVYTLGAINSGDQLLVDYGPVYAGPGMPKQKSS
jgi:hypothetical protein